MPKITDSQRQERRRLIETAATSLFVRRGFHGVGLRDVATEAGVSLGNIYNHYSGKEPIFKAAIARLHLEFVAATEPLAAYFAACKFPDDIEELGKAMGAMVQRHRDYFTLIYVDLAEFQGTHARGFYKDLTDKFRAALAGRAPVGDPRFAPGVDPAVALTLIYMQYVNYFVVEELIGAKGHLGLDDDSAVRTIAHTFLFGLAPRSGRGQEK